MHVSVSSVRRGSTKSLSGFHCWQEENPLAAAMLLTEEGSGEVPLA